MDKFLESYNFPRPNQEEIESLKKKKKKKVCRPLTSTEIETVIRKPPKH